MATESVGRLEPDYERAYVVYDGETGLIVHVHRTLTFQGAEGPPEEDGARMAVEMARQLGHDEEHPNLRALSVELAALEEPTRHRVDLDAMKLVRDRADEAP
jgi:hypothetical protein